MSSPVPPTHISSPDAVRQFFATLALHVLGVIFAAFGVILCYGLLGGVIAACGGMPLTTNPKSEPPWVWNVCRFVAGVAIVSGLVGGLVWSVVWVREQFTVRRWLRLVAYPIVVPLAMSLGVLLAAIWGALFLLCCTLCLGFAFALLVAAPFGAGQDIGLRFFDLRGATFGEGFQIGVLGSSALSLILGLTFGVFGMAADL